VFVVVLGVVVAATRPGPDGPGAAAAEAIASLRAEAPLPRTVAAYAGIGAWVDVYDYLPAYQQAGAAPGIQPSSVDEMKAAGVTTLYLQAARPPGDSRSPGLLADRTLIAEFLLHAHRAGIRVVGWYLPTFADVGADLARVQAIANFSVLGHRFDGVAVDIEATESVPDVATRNAALVQLSTGVRAALGTEAVGAIVLPPVQTEVVNPRYWPAFPWSSIAPLYDAWLPMSYWTFRKSDSGYKDGYTYNEESTRRLRANLGKPDAVVHAIGGLAELATPEDIQKFVQSLAATHAVGGSLYDWKTSSPESRAALSNAMHAAGLAPPP
jgi:hypothetical protein